MAAAVGSTQPTNEQLVESLTEEELNMTVEEYLKAQCAKRVEGIKRHMSNLVESFSSEAKRARQTLAEVASSSARAVANADEDVEADDLARDGTENVDPFALVAIKGFHQGKVLRIQPSDEKKIWTIGRVEGHDVCLAGDDEVSSKHAQISFERKQFKLLDLGSTNGTFATDPGKGSTFKLKKKKNHVLKVDHLVTFGSTTFKWCYDRDATSLAQMVKSSGA